MEKGAGQTRWRVGHAGAGDSSENPTRELLESPAAASHFIGEGTGAGRGANKE